MWMIKISTCIKLSNNEILKNLKSTRKQMLVSHVDIFNSMNIYSHSEAMQFLLTRSYTYPIQKLKAHDRVKTRNTSFIPSFMTQCSLPVLCLSSSPFPAPCYMGYLQFWHVYLFTHVHVYGTGNDPQRIFLRLNNINIVHLFSYKNICTLVYCCSILHRMKWTNRPPSTDKRMAKICIYKFYSTLKKN